MHGDLTTTLIFNCVRLMVEDSHARTNKVT